MRAPLQLQGPHLIRSVVQKDIIEKTAPCVFLVLSVVWESNFCPLNRYRLQRRFMPSRTITIVSYGKEQKLQDTETSNLEFVLKIDCTVFPDSCIIFLKKKLMHEDVLELEEHLRSVNTIADLYGKVQQWINSRPNKTEPLTIYCMSGEGIFRSVALANILGDYLQPQGYDVHTFHARLALLGIHISE